MLYVILLVVGLYFVLSALGTIVSVVLSLLAVPFALLHDLTQKMSGVKSDRSRVRERIDQAERALNSYYERKYFSKNAPADVDENGIPYL